jgi:hypothetical protein
MLIHKSDSFPPSLDSCEPQSLKTWSSQSSQILKSWLKNCSKHHPLCASYWQDPMKERSWVPTRLLYVEGGEQTEKVFLVENLQSTARRDEDIRYATLSYCWGSDPKFIKTTPGVRVEFRKGILVKRLPKVFADD